MAKRPGAEGLRSDKNLTTATARKWDQWDI
jgi:hypothetical protein